jgi:hypothetical protein
LHGNAYALALGNARYGIDELHLMDSRLSSPAELAVPAAMSQADAENSCLSPKRPFGSFHFFRDIR